MLWLQAQEDNGNGVQVDEKAVKHTVANAVGTLFTYIVNRSDDSAEDYPRRRNYLIDRKQPIVGKTAEIDQFVEMLHCQLPFATIKQDSECHKVGQKQSEKRGNIVANAGSQQLCGKQHPHNGHKIKGLHPHNAAETHTEKGVEHPPWRALVLIATENTGVETYHTEHHTGGTHRHKLEGCHRGKQHIATRHHTTVNAYEGVGIVQFHHQEGGKEHAEEGRNNRQVV